MKTALILSVIGILAGVGLTLTPIFIQLNSLEGLVKAHSRQINSLECDLGLLSPKPTVPILRKEAKLTKQPELQPPTTIRTSPGDSIYIDSKGDTFPLHIGPKGGFYIWKTSKKTGKEYKSYIKTN
jgi:hypothetical protein